MIIGTEQKNAESVFRKWNMRRGRNFDTLNEGDKIQYCVCPQTYKWRNGAGINVDCCPQTLVEYEGTVIAKTAHHITLEIIPQEGQIMGYDKPKPYKVSINRIDVGVTDIIRKIAQND